MKKSIKFKAIYSKTDSFTAKTIKETDKSKCQVSMMMSSSQEWQEWK